MVEYDENKSAGSKAPCLVASSTVLKRSRLTPAPDTSPVGPETYLDFMFIEDPFTMS